MTRWDERVDNHELFETLNSLAQGIQAAESPDLDSEARDFLHRIDQGRRYLLRVFDRVDPLLVPIEPMNGMNKLLGQALEALDKFPESEEISVLDTASVYIGRAIRESTKIPKLTTNDDIEGLRESVTSFRLSVGQHLRYFEEEADHVRDEVQDVREAIREQKQEIADQKRRLDTAIQNFVDKSSKAREDHSKEFSDLLAQTTTELKELLEMGEEKLEEKRAELEREAGDFLETIDDEVQQVITRLEKKREEAAKIVGIISRTGMAGGYEQQADSEHRQTQIWRIIAVGAMIGIIVMAIQMVSNAEAGEFALNAFAGKAFSSLAFGILAAYAGREAGKHHRSERRNRRLQLELSSIDSYLDTLEPEKQNAIKAALTDRLFGHPEPPKEPEEDGAMEPNSLMDSLRLFLGREA